MKIEQLTIDDLQRIYDYYLSGNYKLIFRQFPDNLPILEFKRVLDSFGGMIKIIDEDKILGYAICPFYGKPKQMLLSVMVPQKHQKKGNALKIMLFLTQIAFNEYMANRVLCFTVDDDNRTNELLEKGGFVKEGVLLESAFYDSMFHNEIRWSINKPKYIELYGG